MIQSLKRSLMCESPLSAPHVLHVVLCDATKGPFSPNQAPFVMDDVLHKYV